MGTVSEIQQAKAWIYTALHADANILATVGDRIYADFVPGSLDSRAYPYILFNYMGGSDVDGLGTVRIFSEPLFQVRVVTEGRPDAITRALEKSVDDVLQTAVYQLNGDYYFTSRREQPIDRPELDSATGRRYHNLGGLYRLWIGRTT